MEFHDFIGDALITHSVVLIIFWVIAGHGECGVCNFIFKAVMTSTIILIMVGLTTRYGLFT